MVEYKWTQFSSVVPDQEYYAFAEIGERNSVFSFFKFGNRARVMQKQLAGAKGLVGYRAKMEFTGKRVLMVAVFDNKTSLMEFAHTGQHANCMKQTLPDLRDGMKMAEWSIQGSSIPPTIEDAMNRIEKEKKTTLPQPKLL